jgi:hypothetical protein
VVRLTSPSRRLRVLILLTFFKMAKASVLFKIIATTSGTFPFAMQLTIHVSESRKVSSSGPEEQPIIFLRGSYRSKSDGTICDAVFSLTDYSLNFGSGDIIMINYYYGCLSTIYFN